jgi:predicted RNA-binding protein associated with RNAse of E/G family
MNKPSIFRTRFIPFETVDISSDEMLFRDEELLITRWKAIKPRKDISGGISYTFLKEGIKISRFYDADKKFAYWYCDIIDVKYDIDSDSYTLIDLLLDVKLMPDGTMKVLDADELAIALEEGLITQEQACSSLKKMDSILQKVYKGSFPPSACLDEKYWEV